MSKCQNKKREFTLFDGEEKQRVADLADISLQLCRPGVEERILLDKVEINLNNKCNLKCSYCFSVDTGSTSQKEIKLSTVKRFLESNAYSFADNLLIGFMGGEPLLSFGLIKDIVSICKEITLKTGKRFRFSMATNGTLINEEKLRYICRNSINIFISFDGSKKDHNKNRCFYDGSGSYHVVRELLKNLEEKPNKPYIRLNAVLTPESSSMIDVSSSLEEFNSFDYSIGVLKKSSWRDDELEIMRKWFFEFSDYFSDYLLSGGLSKYVGYMKRLNRIHKMKSENRGYSLYPCEGGRSSVILNYDDLVYSCAYKIGDSECLMGRADGVLKPQKRQRFFEKRIFDREECRSCRVKLMCGGECLYTQGNDCDLTRSFWESIIHSYELLSENHYFDPINLCK